MIAKQGAALLAVTDAEGIEHLITEAAMTAGRRAGRYTAACGDEVLAASLTAPESGHCRACRRTGQ
ncbi:MAG: hypothetical protein LC799_16075 [Actinobacteria bacterium]|nr:hypothetical protein [Actinomycetota bacterium]